MRTDKLTDSINEAAEKMGKHAPNISSALKGNKKKYLKLIWEYKN